MTESRQEPGKERLQKILARAGYGSRRACEELIVEGRVTVNDQTTSVLGTRADPQRDRIAVDGERLHLPREAYWILNKKEGEDFNESPETLNEIIPGENGRLFSSGRLDRYSRGLVLITNDGRVANILTHPRYKAAKVYRLVVEGNVTPASLRNLERALYYAFRGGRFGRLKALKRSAGKSQVLLTVYAGLPSSMRDIFLKYGHSIKHVVRERVGCIELSDLPGGAVRKLRGDEVGVLRGYAEEAEAGRLDYEGELVTPAVFPRESGKSDFDRKKSGARNKSLGGQKKFVARSQSRDKAGPPRAGRPKTSRNSRTGSARGGRPGATRDSRPGATRDSKPGATRDSRPGATRDRKPGVTRNRKPGPSRGSRPGSTRNGKPGPHRGKRQGPR